MAFKKFLLTHLVQALALLLLFAISPASANTDFPPEGGAGGGPFRSTCPAGQYLVGTNAHYGFVVDSISLICGTINWDGSIGNIWWEPAAHGGPGGSPVPKTSCDGGEIINAMGLLTGDVPSHKVLRQIVFNCVSTTSSARHNLDIGTAPLSPTMQQNCPVGEAVIGIQGRSGTYVDAAGLLCAPIVKAAPPGLGLCTTGHPFPDDRLYQLHNDGSIWVKNNESCVGRGNACGGGWNMLDNNRTTVQIASYCELYQMLNNGSILHYTGQFGSCTGTPCANWSQIDGNPQTSTIAVSAAYNDPGLNKPPYVYQMHKDGSIWHQNGGGWDMIDNNPATTAIVGGAGGLYQLHKDGKVYRWNANCAAGSPGCPWTLLDQSSDPTTMITAGNGLYQLRKSGAIFRYTGGNGQCTSTTCPGWEPRGKDATTSMIKSGYNDVYRLLKNGQVSVWQGGNWVTLDHSPHNTIAITAGRQLYETRTGGNIFHYNHAPCPNNSAGCDAAFDQYDQNASSEGVVLNGNLAIH